MTEEFDNEYFKGLFRGASLNQFKAAVAKRIEAEKNALVVAESEAEMRRHQGAAAVLKEIFEALEREAPAPVPVAGISGV